VAVTDLDLLRGSLDIIVLRTLSGGPAHGLAIARWIRGVTDDALQIDEGSLYPALYRMENRGWIRASWHVTRNNRRAKYYALTALGRRQLAQQTTTWNAFVGAVAKVFAANTSAVPEPAK
jgi:transcriptional regulator